MPITPLHLGVLAPMNHFAPGKVNNLSFIVANLWMDQASIIYTLTGYGAISHADHVFWWAFLMAAIIGVFRWSRAWWLGAFLGSTSHIALDTLVHADVSPFAPLLEGNPFYLGLMQPMSLVLLGLCAWVTAQYVSGIRGWASRGLVAARARLVGPRSRGRRPGPRVSLFVWPLARLWRWR